MLDEQSGERDTEFGISDSIKKNSPRDWAGDLETTPHLRSPVIDKDCYPFIDVDDFEYKDDKPKAGESYAAPDEEGGTASDELLMLNASEDDYEVFNLRIIHRKNRTGFEENKDFPIVLNSIVAGRYHITEYLGSAAFSKVVQAHDLHTGIDVCLKIIKNDKDFFDQSLDEIKLLKYVNKHDPGDERHILRLYDYFYHQEHLFIVCELLRADLYEFQKYNRESGSEPYFTMLRLKTITRQCLVALEYLHGLGIIHCDLKPENILIKSYRRCEIKVIDLGSSCFQTDSLSLYVQSRSYRAPEVILGLHYDQRIDIWSLGCVLAELCSGEVLLPNEEIPMLLARVIGVLGPIDMDMLIEGQETHKYFTKEYDLYHINEDTNQLEYIIPEETSLEDQLQVSDPLFIDFVRKLLQINPITRPTATEALEHPWLS
nr:dual specificity tyrosine-phosphorylation-regulated kinase 4 isoform X2 [Ipomoea batatas]